MRRSSHKMSPNARPASAGLFVFPPVRQLARRTAQDTGESAGRRRRDFARTAGEHIAHASGRDLTVRRRAGGLRRLSTALTA